LIIEITEGAMVQDVEIASRNVAALHGLGVQLAVDDFGTGYSSLSHLQRFPIDIVKIDRSFVAGVDGGKEEAALAKAIVRLAQTLGLDVIAEGVETPAQAQQLRAVGCELAQGFYFAEPLRADALRALLVRGPVSHPGALYAAGR
jgi:EAL domain-containing protein (putative c-di-GMP-specific phosphodiesterase class I)